MEEIHDKWATFYSMNDIKLLSLLNNEAKKKSFFYSLGNFIIESLLLTHSYKSFNKILPIEFLKLFSTFYDECGYSLYYKLDRNYIIRKSYCEENFDFSLRRKS